MRAILTCVFVFLMSINSKEVIILKKDEPKPILTDSLSTMSHTDKIVKELYILHPAFRNKVVKLLHECHKQGIDLRVIETYRTHERQDNLKRKKLSRLSGGCSKHQHFIAVDVVPVVKEMPQWYNKQLWNKIGRIGENEGLTWGGRWKKLYDPGHFEMPIKIDSLHTLEVPDTVLIPLNY